MPRVIRTVIPRIKKSLRDHGLAASLRRSFLLPIHLLKEFRAARNLKPDECRSEFDRTHDVDTDGEYEGWTYLSDLNIASANWIDGNDYLAIEPARFMQVLAMLDIDTGDYTFVDFGSGKGRALLLASEFPFTRIVGLEFAPELHAIAEENIRRYHSQTQKCRDIQSRNVDFVGFSLPPGPLVLFFFDPCRGPALHKVVATIGQSLKMNPRPVYVVYIAPRGECEQVLSSAEFLREISRSKEMNFVVYSSVGSV